MSPESPQPGTAGTGPRRLRLRYSGTCVLCGAALARGAEALYDPASKTVRCVPCPVAGAGPTDEPIELGVAGGSTTREYDLRRARRAARITGRFGHRLGGLILGLTDEPQSTRAWAQGARGEEELAAWLATIPGVTVLHDRRAPGTPANIDHLVVAPAGVFVVDAKLYGGRIEVRDVGGFFRTDLRLYVGGRDHSKLAEAMAWQVTAVERALQAAAREAMPPITPVLCFIKGDLPWFRPPDSYRGVRLESERSIRTLVTGAQVLDGAAVERLARILATAFPPR